jgi:putative sensory transduction regulator
MATKPLDTLAIPVLEDAQFIYEISGDGEALLFILRSPEFTLQWAVIDYPLMGLLSIEAWNVVAFQPADNKALQLCNQFNGKCAGKFGLDDLGHLQYCLDLPYTESTTPSDFEHALVLAVSTVSNNYEVWMRARWSPRKRNQRKDPNRRSKTVEELIEEALQGD